ncbi:FAD-dependent monooxygenase [Actinomadura sp. 9N407]|uniref:FAD-dependent oxidoreductase n=1 Tax=Actinomadura sp. 9N407 TaxID=3375154 RepID=UPI0037A97830
MTACILPVVIVGAGPIGLIPALGLQHYGVSALVFEEDRRLSIDTKAGTIITRTLEVLDRYGVVDDVLAQSLRIEEIGEPARATNQRTLSVWTGELTEDTRFPFVINIPQHELEPILQVLSTSGAKHPTFFTKAPGTVIGPTDDINYDPAISGE